MSSKGTAGRSGLTCANISSQRPPEPLNRRSLAGGHREAGHCVLQPVSNKGAGALPSQDCKLQLLTNPFIIRPVPNPHGLGATRAAGERGHGEAWAWVEVLWSHNTQPHLDPADPLAVCSKPPPARRPRAGTSVLASCSTLQLRAGVGGIFCVQPHSQGLVFL